MFDPIVLRLSVSLLRKNKGHKALRVVSLCPFVYLYDLNSESREISLWTRYRASADIPE